MTNSVLETKTCQVTFSLPPEAKVLVEKGDPVIVGKLLFQTPERFQEFNLIKVLKVSPAKLGQYLLVGPGFRVKEGQILAQKKSLLGQEFFKSPVDGLVTEILPEGFIKIKVGEKEDFKSPLKGRVKEVGTDGLVLEFEAAVLTASWGQGPGKWGEIEILEREEEIKLTDLSKSALGKILVVVGKASCGFVYKAEALEACGVVCGSLEKEMKTVDLSLLVLGKEDLTAKLIWDTLKKHAGERAFISGEKKTLEVPLN